MKITERKRLTVVVPVYNEEVDLPKNVPILYSFLKKNLTGKYNWKIVIADNGPSTDNTPMLAKRLAKKYPEIKYVSMNQAGRGNALKKVWLKDSADILAYMDVDLSSELKYFLRLIGEIEKGADIAIGSRLLSGSRVYGRTLTREVLSRGYNLIIKLMFWVKFHDAQCGFKAINQRVAKIILPLVKDKTWFFDTELLILAEKSGFRISEVPIVWRDNPKSTVKVAKTAWGDIMGLVRLFFSRPWRKIRKKLQ